MLGRDGRGRYDSTWTQVSGVPEEVEEVMLALSSEDGNSGEGAGKRREAWPDSDHEGEQGMQGLVDHVEDAVYFLRWTGNHGKAWQRYSRKTTSGCAVISGWRETMVVWTRRWPRGKWVYSRDPWEVESAGSGGCLLWLRL